MRLVVRDDGHGKPGPGAGNGFATMRERAEELGGTLSVSLEPGQGTVVAAVLPRALA